MTLFALTLVLLSASLHATWNLLSKRAGGGAPFVWLVAVSVSVIYLPAVAALILYYRLSFSPTQYLFMAVSGTLHTLYFLTLQRGYRVGDLSLVYPLARGTGPALSTIGAIVIFAERPSVVALFGAAAIVTGVFIITGQKNTAGVTDPHRRRAGLIYGLITGLLISTYTLWDKHAVTGALALPPLILDYASAVFRTAILTPTVRRRWPEVREHWRTHRREVFGVAVLCPLSYLLILFALKTAPVSYVAPAREISIVIGVFLGAKLLGEGDTPRRAAASALMLAGLAAIAFS